MEEPRRRSQWRDQASNLRALARSAPPALGRQNARSLSDLRARTTAGQQTTAHTIAVASGKGGVGKTNLAVNLSICLAARGLRVTLVDADMGLANADLLMNLRPRYTIAHVVSGLRTVDEIRAEGPAGIGFVPGASGIDQLANLTEFERQSLITQLQKLEASTDIVVLDCGAGISRSVVSFAVSADRLVVVTTCEPTALTDAYAMIKTAHRERYAGVVSLFVNMADSRADARTAHRRVAGVARKFLNYSVADAGYMLHDTAVELAVQQRVPVVVRYPRSNASACIAATATRLARSLTGQPGRGGFFERVVGLFV
ncbi:MAG: MinD/ParA family protein [Phycisphaerae bacterium]